MALLVIDWISGRLMHAGLGLCVVHGVAVLLMLALQRHHRQCWCDVADVPEELTTTWHLGVAIIIPWPLSRVLQNNVLLALAGPIILAEPVTVSLLAEDKKLHHPTFKHRARR